MAAEVRIWLLGGFRVEVDSRPVRDDAWRRNKAKAVVKLLALAPSQRLHREQLMDVLWPELPPDAAAANLRKAVHFARQALAPEHLKSRQEVLELAAERLWVDVHAFQAAAQAGDLAAAIGLYAGELLPEDRFEPGRSSSGSSSPRASAGCCWSGRPSWRPPATSGARRGRWSGWPPWSR